MKNKSIIGVILGVAVFIAGLMVMETHAVWGMVVIIGGICTVLGCSVSAMFKSNSMPASFFHGTVDRVHKLDRKNGSEDPGNIWDQLKENKGDSK